MMGRDLPPQKDKETEGKKAIGLPKEKVGVKFDAMLADLLRTARNYDDADKPYHVKVRGNALSALCEMLATKVLELEERIKELEGGNSGC